MWIRSTMLFLAVVFAFSQLALSYDDETSILQQQGEKNQSKVKSRVTAVQGPDGVLYGGELLTKEVSNPGELVGRTKALYNFWLRKGLNPKIYEITRRGVPALLVTANVDKSPTGFRYAFSLKPTRVKSVKSN